MLAGSGDAAVAAVEDDDLVLCRRLVGEGHHFAECQTVVPLRAVASAQKPTGTVDVAVAREVQQRNVGVVTE